MLAPLVRGRKGEFRDLFEDVRKRGFVRVRVDGETYDLGSVPTLNRRQNHDVAVVVDRLVVRAADRGRLNDSIETALKTADGLVEVVRHGDGTAHALLRALRLSGLRPLAPRARAPPVLLQLAVRRLSRLPRARHPAGGHRRAGPRRPQHLDPRRRDPAVGRAHRLPAEGRAARPWPGRSSSTSTAPWGEHSAAAQQALLHGAPGQVQVPDRRGPRPRASTRASGRACSGTSSAATASRRSDAVRGSLEEFMIEQPCQTCGGKRLKPESLAVLVHGTRHRRRGRPAGRARHGVLRGRPAAARRGPAPGSTPTSPARSSRK